jgi:tetratricopeptide (TPR) repeat protein
VGRREEALETAGEAVAIRRQLAEASPAAYLPGLAESLNNLANILNEVGRREEALETAGEAVGLYRQLAEASPEAYLPDLAVSLDNLANILSEAGQADRAEELFADTLDAFADSTLGIGHILRARGRWRAGQTRMADAIPDLAAAVSTFEREDDRIARGQARLALRILRENDRPAFDRAWGQADGPLPVWLEHLTDTQQLTDQILAWIGISDWQASRAYLDDNATDLLTDETQAAIEHLIDINPAADTLQEHLELLTAARAHGANAAYAAHQEQLLTRHLTQTLGQWLATRTWPASRAFAAAHGDDLLHPAARAVFDDLSSQNPADPMLRLHRGLLGYAATAGFDAAYDLLPDTGRQRAMIADPATPAATRLAIARMHSGQAADDPVAHFQLAAATLLAIENQSGPPAREAADVLAREAAAALADCAANAAPYEQRDFARRLSQLGTEHPPLTAYTAELEHILIGKPDANPS